MKSNEVDERRRKFLKTAALAGAGAAVAVPAVLRGNDAEAFEAPSEQVQSRYQLTEHVKRFYFLNSL